MGVKRSASAVWSGGLKDGKGTVSAESGVLSNVPYNFSKRFESEKGTNPEELIAAAHAACFSMALSLFLGSAGMTAESIETTATVSLDQVDGGFAITSSHLQTTVKIPERRRGRVSEGRRDGKKRMPRIQAPQRHDYAGRQARLAWFLTRSHRCPIQSARFCSTKATRCGR